MMNCFHRSLAPKLILVLIIALLVSTFLGVLVVRTTMQEELEQLALDEQKVHVRLAQALLEAKGGPLSLKNGNLYAGKTKLNGDTILIDSIKDLTGSSITIFQDDKCIATNVVLEDGTRALGFSLASRKELYQAVMHRGETVWRPINVLGVPYLAAYAPLTTESGETVGILFAGVKRGDFFETLSDYFVWITLLLFAINGLITISAYQLIKKLLSPIKDLKETMAIITRPGNHLRQSDVPHQEKTDEIGIFARQLVEMLRSYKKNAQLVRASAIQETNAKLQEERQRITLSENKALSKALKDQENHKHQLEKQPNSKSSL